MKGTNMEHAALYGFAVGFTTTLLTALCLVLVLS